MAIFVCTACATSFPPADGPPPVCPICEDERQFVPVRGQAWTTADAVDSGHKALIAFDGPLLGVGMAPCFAIGQRALLVRTAAGNVLWDCIPFLDPALLSIVEALGGLAAIAISHPHYYGRMAEWSAAFGGVPIHCHADDRPWAMDPGPNAVFWSGERKALLPGLTLVRCGGHFAGGTVLHVAPGMATAMRKSHSFDASHEIMEDRRRGLLLTGDILQVTPGGTHVAFMRSYPNMIPLGVAPVRRLAAAIEDLDFDTVLGAFWGRVIPSGGKAAVAASVERHAAWVNDERDADS